jgi:hypothetical protein
VSLRAVMPGRLELALAALGLVALAAAVYGAHAVNGGFISDDWALQADVAKGGGFFGGLDRLLETGNIANRPLMALYMASTHALFGTHMGFHLATAAGLGALMAWSVYLLLRLLGTERVHAAAVAALVLVFPAADSVRLWAGAAAGQLTVTFLLLGLSLAVLGFRATGRRALWLHGGSLALYLSSILLHESTLVGIGAAVLLYRLVAPWRPALTRWLVDVGSAGVLVLLLTARSSAWPRQDLAGQLDHAFAIYDQALVLLTSIALPFGGSWIAALPLLALVAAAAVVARRLERRDPAREQLVRWLGLVAAGVVVVVAGYLIYVPAISYYVPAAVGIANRMNVLPSVGFVLIAYGCVVLAALLAFRTLRRRAVLVTACGVAAAVVLGAGYVGRVADDSARFDRAYALGAETLSALKATVPKPPPGSTIYSAGQPIEVEPGFPVYGNTWDLTGALRVVWRDHSLIGLPLFPGTTFACEADGVEPVNPRYGGTSDGPPALFKSPYGKTVLFHAPSRRFEVVSTPEQCRTIGQRFPPGPEYAPPAP